VGSTACLDVAVKKKIPSPYRDSIPPIIQPVAQRHTMCSASVRYRSSSNLLLSHLSMNPIRLSLRTIALNFRLTKEIECYSPDFLQQICSPLFYFVFSLR
jgi:hypothetical protein